MAVEVGGKGQVLERSPSERAEPAPPGGTAGVDDEDGAVLVSDQMRVIGDGALAAVPAGHRLCLLHCRGHGVLPFVVLTY